MKKLEADEKILSLDIGGSRIKGTVLDVSGKMLMDYVRITTPVAAGPSQVLQCITDLTKGFQSYSRVSVGFPGYVRNGVVHTAPNLSTEKWAGIDLSAKLTELLKQPTRVLNDADLQGLGLASGTGLEMVVTLGTGFGTALLMNGNLLPHFEIAHHPVTKSKDYDQYIGQKVLDQIGIDRWNRRMKRVLGVLKTVFVYDHLYISGGNSKKINFKTDTNISLVSNVDGIKGGAKLWRSENQYNV